MVRLEDKEQDPRRINDKEEIRAIIQQLVMEGRDARVQKIDSSVPERWSFLEEEENRFVLDLELIHHRKLDWKLEKTLAIQFLYENKPYQMICAFKGFSKDEVRFEHPKYMTLMDLYQLTHVQIIPPIKCFFTTKKLDPVEGVVTGIGEDGVEIKPKRGDLEDILRVNRESFLECRLPDGPAIKTSTNVKYLSPKGLGGLEFTGFNEDEKQEISIWIKEAKQRVRMQRMSGLKDHVEKKIAKHTEIDPSTQFTKNLTILSEGKDQWLIYNAPGDVENRLVGALKRKYGLYSTSRFPKPEKLPDSIKALLVYMPNTHELNSYTDSFWDNFNRPVIFCGPAGSNADDWKNLAFNKGAADFIDTDNFSTLKCFKTCGNAWAMFYPE